MTAPYPGAGGGAAPSGFVDLHMHSTASDGSRAPADVVREAKRVGLIAIALTDHDTLDGLPEAMATGTELGVRVVPGIELSAVEGDVETHILGLHLSDTRELESRLVALREMRRTRAQRIVERLNELGVRIEFTAVLDQAAGGAIGRPHVARAMIAEGWAVDFRDAFERYLGNGKAAYVGKDRLAVADAIGLIHNAGGLAILAHPASGGTRARVEQFVQEGIDGVEVRHPSHSSEDIARLSALVEHFSLVPSGGSDWHGATDGPRTLGMMRVPEEWLGRQDGRVRARPPRAA
ncbi:MAG TPA: PHP domain-containing protein [Gemmatimonadaceae bacterium]|nr:PHP domain-containing protein [Gemmatimonadaceae bacterium]